MGTFELHSPMKFFLTILLPWDFFQVSNIFKTRDAKSRVGEDIEFWFMVLVVNSY